MRISFSQRAWRWRTFGMACLLACLCHTSTAQVFESTDNIARTARTFLADEMQRRYPNHTVQVEVDPLDARLQFAQCDHAVRAELAPGSHKRGGNVSVRVFCTEPTRWSVFVPSRVTIFGQVLVVARPLARSQRITAADVQLEQRDVSVLPNGYFDTPSAVLGLQTKRVLVPGQVLNSGQLMPPLLIKRGQLVTLRAGAGGVHVDMQGEALADGSLGQRIQARNQSSRRVVEGVIIADGIIEVAQ
ncbi:flagellar basal body P-ring formation protein FlgA [Thiospirillum jenense]|uniref:Flagella basal body P-ring formation protein FlgA n=2 Tax=Thiospirillum jenense TaxID=1653858 RepID=A0A839HDD6_9GAMM|nr:flagellar basal body P-ring formation protein FlgA [Thiospirillum jenense]